MSMASGVPLRIQPTSARARTRALQWLHLATTAVAVSALFAILIVLARVPAIGALFPGAQFYRVALTLHVNLSQLVWFSTFACMLWSLSAGRRYRTEPYALASCAAGALLMIAAALSGDVRPIMSNYLPVLDSGVFLAGLLAFAIGLALQASNGVRGLPTAFRDRDPVGVALGLAALAIVLALAMLPWSAIELAGHVNEGYFEALFWGSGHVWEFALTTLMMLAWSSMIVDRNGHSVVPARQLVQFLILANLPLLVAVAVQVSQPVLSAGYRSGFTEIMRYASWEFPLLLGLILLRHAGRSSSGWQRPVFTLSLGLFVAGLILGACIREQTTVVTAHYHGTIGAVTLAFMGLTYQLMPALGLARTRPRAIVVQTACYGWGNLLMMAGLGGAGLMGAPRKVPGKVDVDIGVETLSRIVLGIGGSLALVGILGFFLLVMRELRAHRPVVKGVVAHR